MVAPLGYPAAVAGVTRLGPAVPAGVGAVLNWLMENGEMEVAVELSHAVMNGNGAGMKRTPIAKRKFALPSPQLKKKVKRKASPYQKEFGKQLKKLKKKHPRTPVTKLMKKAHSATKRARRGK